MGALAIFGPPTMPYEVLSWPFGRDKRQYRYSSGAAAIPFSLILTAAARIAAAYRSV
jgi:hypothetical protein